MISYIMLGTNTLQEAADFYDNLLSGMGAELAFNTETLVAWRFGEGSTMLAITTPFDGNQATTGNGTMVALSVETSEMVDTLHANALALGARNEGDPGSRGGGFYAGYFRDLDGNKLNFFCYE